MQPFRIAAIGFLLLWWAAAGPQAHAQDLEVAAPQTSGTAGATFHIPITLDHVPAEGVASFQFRLTFSAGQFDPTGFIKAGTLSESWSIVANTGVDGQVFVSGASNPGDEITQGGILLILEGELGVEGTTPLTFDAANTLFEDENGNTISTTLVDGQLTVNGLPNTPPTFINELPSQTIQLGQTLTFTYTASDANGDPLTYSLVSPPAGAAINAQTGALSFTPAAAGTFTINARVSDGQDEDLATATITVDPAPNQSPSFDQTLPDQNLQLGQTLAFTYTATDPNNDPLTFALDSPPVGAAINPQTGLFTFTPTATGPFTITALVSDGQEQASTSAVVTVTDVPNRAPVFDQVLASQNLEEGQTLTFTYTANDADGDALTFGLNSPPAGAAIDAQTGVLTYTPPTTGSFTLEVFVSDGEAEVTTSAVVTVTPVPNRAPVFTATLQSQSIPVGQPFTFTYTASDADGDALTFGLNSAPAGAAVNAQTGVFTFTPPATGAFTIEVFVTDDEVQTTTSAVLTVIIPNRAPTFFATMSSRNVRTNELVTFTYGATDPDDDALTFSLIDPPSGATINAQTGAFTFRPVFENTYTITVQVSDGELTAQTQATVTATGPDQVMLAMENVRGNPGETFLAALNVTGVGGAGFAPQANNDISAFQVELVYNPADFSIDDVVFAGTLSAGFNTNVTTPQPGRLLITGQAAGAPNITQDGALFKLRLTLITRGGSAIMINAANTELLNASGNAFPLVTQDAAIQINTRPQLTATPGSVSVAEGSTYTFTYQASDVDAADVLTFSLVQAPTGATIGAQSGAFTFTPSFSQGGQTYNVIVMVSDGVAEDRNTDAITVTNTNRRPTFIAKPATPVSVDVGVSYRFTFTATDPDVATDGDTFAFTLAQGPGGAAIDAQSGVFTFTPTAAGTSNVTVRVIDAGGAFTDFAFTITATEQARVTSITVAPAGQTVVVGRTLQFTATAVDQNGAPIAFTPTWSTTAPGAGITAGGLLTAGATVGTFEVRATDAATGVVGTAPVTVALNVGTEGTPDVPGVFALHQNYPNPFNPRTAITVDLPTATVVRLSIFNMLGHEVAVLMDGDLAGGQHTFTWDAGELPSGIYLYRVQTPQHTAARRLILLK